MMRTLFLIPLALLALPAASLRAQEPAPPPAPAAVSTTEPASEALTRSAALELAGAFSNDGFKIRDGFWASEVSPETSPIIQVNLFEGNEYWFCAGATLEARTLSIQIYDDSGAPLDQESYGDGHMAGAGIVATYSGVYYVKVSLAEGGKTPFCLVYCYK